MNFDEPGPESEYMENPLSFIEFFTFDEFQICFRRKRVSSVAGLNGVSYEMIKDLPDFNRDQF